MDSEGIRAQCAQAIAQAARRATPTRVVTLLPFATFPRLAELVDPAELPAEALSIQEGAQWEYGEREAAITGLFPTLLTRRPEVALRLFSIPIEILRRRWTASRSPACESSRPPVVSLLGEFTRGSPREGRRTEPSTNLRWTFDQSSGVWGVIRNCHSVAFSSAGLSIGVPQGLDVTLGWVGTMQVVFCQME